MVIGAEEDITEVEVRDETENEVIREITEAVEVIILSWREGKAVVVVVGKDWTEDIEISAGYGWLGEVKEGIDEGKDKMDVTDDEGLGRG